ncbi:SusC/RagA family TonB-linked outer membrane protein [Sphingobacterium sp. LRF_L2]|uniref:SusC/RagA family TonB-linked outer membrane protein n=1 Tax=Sphingobacterium sp. LRF_L2 TaxID=3369421 RepID=UPI003F5DA1CE
MIFFYFLLIPFAYGQALKEQVNVKLNNTSLEKALKILETKSAVRFVFNDSHTKSTSRLNGTFSGSLESVVSQILAPFQLEYSFIDNQYFVLKHKGTTSNTRSITTVAIPVNQNGFVQSGIVTDEKGNGLAGVTVTVRNASNIVQTDEQGFFNIGIIDDRYVLEFHYLGYKTVTQKSQRNGNLRILLEEDPSNLDEVMIIGYGTTTKRFTTGSSAGVSAKDIQNTPTTNVANALQGRVAGVYVNQANGLPGSPMSISIRGNNSMVPLGTTINRNAPLFIVDGVPFSSDAIASSVGTGLVGANGAASPLNLINPMDIESIDVLKDADATAIYGSRAANGVVLITTKKGKVGKTQFDALFRTGAAKVANFVKTLNTEQYLAMRRRAFDNAIALRATNTPENLNAFDLTKWDQTAYTDFQKLLIGNTAKTTDANLALGGGDQRTNFRLSGTYHKEGNVFVGDQGYDRTALNFNLQHKTLNERFTIGFSAIYTADKNNVSVLDQTAIAYNLPPNYPLYNSDGSLYWSGLTFGVPNNPLGQLNQTVENKGSNLIGNLNLDYRIWKGLSFKTNLGYGRADADQKRLVPRSSMDPSLSSSVSNSQFAFISNNNYTIEPQINYNTDLGKGKLSTMVGGTWQHTLSKQPFYTSARDFPSDDFLENIASAATVSNSRNSSEYKYASLFARANYNFSGKYIANVNFRRDGSSRFAKNKRYGNFGSFGGAWIISEESFFKYIPVVSFAKLRSSYGWVGNDKIGDYQYFDSYQSVSYLYNGIAGMVPTRLANSNFQWETTRKFEVAFDLSILKDRLSLSAAFYKNLSGNQLINYSLSPQAGFSSFQSNFPAIVENKGWEFTASSQNITKSDFRWTTDFNISFNRNRLAEFPNIDKTSYYTQYIVGNPLSGYYTYDYLGFDPDTGLPSFADLNGDGRISSGLFEIDRGDRSYKGTNLPKFYGGLSNTLSYKNLTLDFLFQFVKQKGRSILASSYYNPGYDMTNYAAEPIMEYLNQGLESQPQALAVFGDAYTAFSNYVASDATLVDASFIRLKNVSLSYDVRGQFIERLKLKNLRLQIQGHNLFTITDYLGFDPESQGLSLPPLRTIVGSVQLTF